MVRGLADVLALLAPLVEDAVHFGECLLDTLHGGTMPWDMGESIEIGGLGGIFSGNYRSRTTFGDFGGFQGVAVSKP